MLQLNGGALLVAAAATSALALAGGGAGQEALGARGAGASQAGPGLTTGWQAVALLDVPIIDSCLPAWLAPADMLPAAATAAAPADLLRLALAGQGLADTLSALYYGATLSPLLGMLLQLAAGGVTLAVPAADLLLNGRLRVSTREAERWPLDVACACPLQKI